MNSTAIQPNHANASLTEILKARSIDSSPQSLRARILSIVKAALPVLISLESIAAIGIVDLELAGRLSPSHQAAVGLGDQLLFLTSTAATGLSVATCAVVARYFGAGKTKRLMAGIRASLSAATICGIIAMILGLVAADCFVRILSSDESVISVGVRYIQLCAIGSLPYVVSIVVSSIFRAIGKTAESLYLSLSTSAISIGLSYVLFLIDCPFRNTLDALCFAWIIGAYSGLLIGLFVLRKQLQKFPSSAKSGHQEIRLLKLLLVIGSAVVVADSSTLASDFLVYKIISTMPDATNIQAAWTIFLKVEETFAIMPICALTLAFAASVGQLFGQGKEDDARECLQFLIKALAILFSVVGLAVLAAPQALELITHGQGSVTENARIMLVFVPLLYPLLAIRLVIFSFMEGAGQTSAPMKLALAGNAMKLAIATLLICIIPLGPGGLVAALCASHTFMALGAIRVSSRSPFSAALATRKSRQGCRRSQELRDSSIKQSG